MEKLIRFNINIVECKLYNICWSSIKVLGFNINIVECKSLCIKSCTYGNTF